MTSLEKLLSISSESISHHAAVVNFNDLGDFGELGRQLESLLRKRNGFYTFESALHVFPAVEQKEEMTLGQWNSFRLWRFEYGEFADRTLFFAEDAFGNQFTLHQEQVCCFDAETGTQTALCDSIEEWAKSLAADYNFLTGYPLIHEWQGKRCLATWNEINAQNSIPPRWEILIR
ncbi:MAG TPA: hypothetical protein VFK06_24755 [Candidatus Angelobacter sp.]|nr:hypothetical protein [Candidatus Angelobacter sp.]